MYKFWSSLKFFSLVDSSWVYSTVSYICFRIPAKLLHYWWTNYFLGYVQGGNSLLSRVCISSVGHEAVAKKQWRFYFHEYIFHEVWARSLITLDLASVLKLNLKCCSFMMVFCSIQNHDGLKNKDDFSEMVFLCPIVRGWWDKMNASTICWKKQQEVCLKHAHDFY